MQQQMRKTVYKYSCLLSQREGQYVYCDAFRAILLYALSQHPRFQQLSLDPLLNIPLPSWIPILKPILFVTPIFGIVCWKLPDQKLEFGPNMRSSSLHHFRYHNMVMHVTYYISVHPQQDMSCCIYAVLVSLIICTVTLISFNNAIHP